MFNDNKHILYVKFRFRKYVYNDKENILLTISIYILYIYKNDFLNNL